MFLFPGFPQTYRISSLLTAAFAPYREIEEIVCSVMRESIPQEPAF